MSQTSETSEAGELNLRRALADLPAHHPDPATWARDVGEFARRGWKLGEVTPHDFYPQTSHVEIVSVLNR